MCKVPDEVLSADTPRSISDTDDLAALFICRAEALALSSISAEQWIDRATLDAAIRDSIVAHGGSHGCAAALAYEFGARPETAPARMRWARQVVANIYGAASVELHLTATLTEQVRDMLAGPVLAC